MVDMKSSLVYYVNYLIALSHKQLQPQCEYWIVTKIGNLHGLFSKSLLYSLIQPILNLHYDHYCFSPTHAILPSISFSFCSRFLPCYTGADPPCDTALGGMILAHIPPMSCSHFFRFQFLLAFSVWALAFFTFLVSLDLLRCYLFL
jgi:hypothetical protein